MRLLLLILLLLNNGNEVYPKTAIVTSVRENIVTVTDYSGNEWQFKDTDWEIGDVCSMIMSDNGTDTIYDDKIIAKRYSGYVGRK